MTKSFRWRTALSGLLLAVCWTASERSAVAQDSIGLKNGLTSPITVLVQAAGQDEPTRIELGAGDVFPFPLKSDGAHTIQVIPLDQKTSGYNLADLNLRVLAKALNGKPLDLQGDFETFFDACHSIVFRVRVAVHFDVPDPKTGTLVRRSAPRTEYMRGFKEPQAVGTTSIITLVVPADAKVTFDDTPTTSAGTLRFYQTPPLDRGKAYFYTLRVVWTKDGQRCEQTHKITVRAGEVSRDYFLLPVGGTAGY